MKTQPGHTVPLALQFPCTPYHALRSASVCQSGAGFLHHKYAPAMIPRQEVANLTGDGASHLSSLWKTVRVASQLIILCQKYQQFKFIWKDALGKQNWFQFSVKVLDKNERPRNYQKLPLWAEQWLVGLPSLLSDLQSCLLTCKERPSGYFRVSIGFGPKIYQETEACPWGEVIPSWRSYRDLNKHFILFLKSKKNFGSKAISGVEAPSGQSAKPINTESQAFHWILWFSGSGVGPQETDNERCLETMI